MSDPAPAAPWSIAARWGRQKGCLAIYDPATGEAVEVETRHLKAPDGNEKTDLRWAYDRIPPRSPPPRSPPARAAPPE